MFTERFNIGIQITVVSYRILNRSSVRPPLGECMLNLRFGMYILEKGEPLGLPWNQGSSYLQNVSSFVSLWINVTKTLKSYNNVLFELFNEPNDARL